MMDQHSLIVEVGRPGLSTEFSSLFRSLASLYNAVYEELEHRAPSRGAERLRVHRIEVESRGHIVMGGIPLITQWVDLLIHASNAAVGAAGIWLAFKAQSQVGWHKREGQALSSENDWLIRLNTVLPLDLFLAEAERLESKYDLSQAPDFPPPRTDDEEKNQHQLTFEFLADDWTEFSLNDKKGIQALQHVKAMQRRRLILTPSIEG